MAETKKPAVKSAAVKKPAASKPAEKKAPVKKAAAPKAAAIKTEVSKPVAKKASKGNKIRVESTRLLDRYQSEIKKAMMDKYHYSSIMQVPHLEKIVINVGVGEAITNAKLLEESVSELAQITGQHPVTTKAKKSIATYKLREGQAIGCKVTLRGLNMYEFYDRLVSIALPRVRDFRGVSKNAFDGHGNYTLGVKEQLIFPEIDYDKVSKIRGMDIVIVTTANSDEEAYSLLELMGMPFHK
jgi:large subunit ribosomal protein L5